MGITHVLLHFHDIFILISLLIRDSDSHMLVKDLTCYIIIHLVFILKRYYVWTER